MKKLIIENEIDFVDQHYILMMIVQKWKMIFKKLNGRTRLIIVYNDERGE